MEIRKAIKADTLFIADYLLLAMQDIVYKFLDTEDSNKAKDFLLHFLNTENNQYSWQNCWVIVIDNKVVGTALVYNGADLQKLKTPVINYIKTYYNDKIYIENETQADEYYIDCIAINPNLQGKGIGSKLLHFLINHYVIESKQNLGLLVDKDNPSAERLYLKLGFKPINSKTLMGKTMSHLQLKHVF